MKSRVDTRRPNGEVVIGLKAKYRAAADEGKFKGKPTGKKK